MTLYFPFYIIVHFIGLRLWRRRYKQQMRSAYDRFNEIDFDFENDSEMGSNCSPLPHRRFRATVSSLRP